MENPVVTKDTEYFSVWIYLVLMASHEEKEVLFAGKKIKLMPGQLITGRKKIADFFAISESKVWRILKDFKIEQQIEQQTSNKNSLISLKNWDKYQISEQQTEQQLNSNRTATEQQPNTKQEIKEGKNVRNNNIYTHAYEEFWSAYPRKKDKGNAFKKFNARLVDGFSEVELIKAAKEYARECEENQTSEKYIKHPTTFLSDKFPFLDYLEKQKPKAEPETQEEDEELVGDDW